MSNSLNISNCKVGQNDLGKDCKLSSNRQSMFKDFSSDTKFTFSKCVLSCCRSCSFCLFPRATAKERFKSLYAKEKNKRCERCFLCKSMSFCPTCSKCPQCCPKFGCRGQTAKVLASFAQSGGESKGGLDFTRGIHATLQNQTTSDPIPGDQEWLCSPRQKQSLVSRGNRPHKQVGSRKGHYQILPGLLQPPLSGAKTESEMETYLGPQPSQSLFKTRHLQNGNSGNNKVVSPKGGVGNVTGFQRRLLSYPYQSKITKVPQVFSRKKSLSIHGPSFRARHSSSGIQATLVVKEVKLMAQARGIRIHQYLDDWLVRAPDQETCQLHTQTLLALCHELGWVVNMEKSELTPQQVFNFVGYRFDLLSGRVLPTQDRWIALQQKLQFIKGRDCCSVRQFMSLIGLLTATEKQVWAGRLHMRPVQWHLKRHWHVPKSLEKIIPVPLSLHPHLDWWLDETNVLKGQPLHPLQHALQIFTDASNEGWGAHLGGSIARGVWSEPESRLHINFLELKAVLLALKSFEKQCRGQIVLIATDNTTVVSYINKEGGMKSGSLCALLWRLLAWCHPRKIILRARHIPGRLNVIADNLSRHNQVIQTEWCLSQQVFNRLCSNWGQPQIDLFATRFNHKLPKFVSPVPDSTAWAVDALSLPWSNLDVYAFPPVSLLSQVTSKLVNQGFHRMILIAPGWPNMPWFWDLISLSSQIPFRLPLERNLLTQPFNGLLHRNLNHLNLHAWLLEPRPSGD